MSLNAPFPTTVSVDYATANGTATAGSDYTATQGTITFAPGVALKTIVVPIIDDPDPEPTETFTVNLSNPVGGTVADGQAVATITERVVSIADTVAIEGDQTAHYRGAFVEGLPSGHFNPLTFGPDGNIYTAVGTGTGYNTVQRFDGTTGAFIDTFIANDDVEHRINGVRDIVFRGNYVYVAMPYQRSPAI